MNSNYRRTRRFNSHTYNRFPRELFRSRIFRITRRVNHFIKHFCSDVSFHAVQNCTVRSAIAIGNWHCRFEQIWKMSPMKGSFFVEIARCVRRGPFIFYQPRYQFLNHNRAIFQPTFPFPLCVPSLSSSFLPKTRFEKSIILGAFLRSWIYKVNIFRR